MKRVKRSLLILVMIIPYIFSGCGGMSDDEAPPTESSPTEETGSQSEPPQKTIEINIYQYKLEYKDAIEKAASEFSKENQDIKIIAKTAQNSDDYIAILKSMLSSGQQPDLFNIGRPQDIVDLKDKLSDLSDLEATQFAVEGSLNGVTIDNKIYGLPYNLEGFGFIYNTEMFEEAQIDVDTIDSFAALEDTVKELTKQKENLKIESVFAFPAKDTQITGFHMSNAYISPEFDGDILKTYQSKSIEFKYSEAFKKMIDLQLNYSVKPVNEIDNNKQIELFVGEQVAIISGGNWVYQMVELIDKEFAKKIDMLTYPVEGYKEDANPVGVPMYWAINNNSPQEKQEAAKEFLNWLYLSETGKKVIVDEFKFIPAYKGYAADSVENDLGKQILSQVSAGNMIPQVFMGYPGDWGRGRLGKDILRYSNGELNWDGVIKNAKEAWAKGRE